MADAAKPLVSPARASRAAALWQSAIGKKALMAVTGIVLSLYVAIHLLGNLQMFGSPEQIDRYGELLRVSPQLLWTARIVLLAALLVHVAAGAQLHMAARAARPVAYDDHRPGDSSAASRTMIWSGFLILGFVVYHVLDLTIGAANPDFVPGRIHHNVLASFGRSLAALFYVAAMIGLGFHLWHGLWSMWSSLGVSNRSVQPSLKRFAVGVAVVLTIGFSSIPLAVLFGVLGPPR